MRMAVYDIESSSAITDWSSILEIGGILIDENFNEIDRFESSIITDNDIKQHKTLEKIQKRLVNMKK